MLHMTEMGAQVLKSSAVEFAKRHNMKIYVGSSFTGNILDEIAIVPKTFSFSGTKITLGVDKKFLREAALKIHDSLILDCKK